VGSRRQPLSGAALALALALADPAGAVPPPEADIGQREAAAMDPKVAEAARLCAMIEDAAGDYGLQPEFFARLIWKESRFDVKAVSPKGARGVAQFMPGTAKLRGLADPFDPAQAIPASAAYLAELKLRFGNYGLAAAAYNSGENRVEAWLGGRSGLPGETLAYVHSITFRPAAWFRERGREVEPRPLDAALTFSAACRKLPVMKTRAVFYEGAEWQPWGVEVAANVRYNATLSRFARVQARYGKVIGESEPMLVRARAGLGRQRIWSARIGMASRLEAFRLCAQLQRAGGACVVRRN